MKYVILALAMLCCFAFAGAGHSTAAPSTPSIEAAVQPAAAVADDNETATENTCGGVVCGKGTYCCNASCGLCVPKGMLCTQQVCAAE
jgi:hypothetical protein